MARGVVGRGFVKGMNAGRDADHDMLIGLLPLMRTP
jgi:hypothetical protein